MEPKDKTLEYFKMVLDTVFEQTGTAKDFKMHGEKIPLFEKALISLWSEHCKVVDECNNLKEQWQREAWMAAREKGKPIKHIQGLGWYDQTEIIETIKYKSFEDWRNQ